MSIASLVSSTLTMPSRAEIYSMSSLPPRHNRRGRKLSFHVATWSASWQFSSQSRLFVESIGQCNTTHGLRVLLWSDQSALTIDRKSPASLGPVCDSSGRWAFLFVEPKIPLLSPCPEINGSILNETCRLLLNWLKYIWNEFFFVLFNAIPQRRQ